MLYDIELTIIIIHFIRCIESTTMLDDFKSVFIEPTLDAVTKMTIFIGSKKYKEDFIWSKSQGSIEPREETADNAPI